MLVRPFVNPAAVIIVLCIDKPLILTKPIQTKKSKTWIVSICLIIFILFGLLSCTKEKYPNKMDSIAKALSKIKK
jgi:hypothetical protein